MTLNEIWAGERDITKRAFRAARGDDIYVPLCHKTVDAAVKIAASKQEGFGLEDILATDWEVRD